MFVLILFFAESILCLFDTIWLIYGIQSMIIYVYYRVPRANLFIDVSSTVLEWVISIANFILVPILMFKLYMYLLIQLNRLPLSVFYTVMLLLVFIFFMVSDQFERDGYALEGGVETSRVLGE